MTSLRDIMTTNVASVTALDNAFEVAGKMQQLNVGAIPVVNEQGSIMGMITDRDLVLRGYAQKQSGSAPIESLMSQNIVSATPEMSVDEAAQLMAKHQIRRLPVVENGKMVGIVSIGDLAVRNDLSDEAGQALSSISQSTNTQM